MLNKVQLIGRVGQNPELKYTQNGQPVASASLATNKKWKDSKSGQKQEKTEWHNLTFWGKLGEIVNQYVKKGSQIYVEGEIETQSWDDPQTGEKKYKTQINVRNMHMLDSKNNNQQSQGNFQPQQPASNDWQNGFEGSEIPF